MDKKKSNRSKKTRGGVLILVVTMLLFLCGFAALAIDVGFVFIVRNELQNALANITSHSLQPIVAFGAIHIDFAVGGSSKYVQMHFIKDYKALNSNPGGPNYGAYTPSRPVK